MAAASGLGGSGGRLAGQRTPEQEEARNRVLRSIREFRRKPRDVKAYLDRYVVEQDEAKKVLAVALCDHYNWARACLDDPALKDANYTKPNILILGPTGSGKTYLVRTLAKMLGVPFVKADATKFTETGIVGEDAEDVVRSLVDAAGGDLDLAKYGMVYIDEVDKIAAGGRAGVGGWSGKQVQSNFLKIMEDTEVSIQNPLQASMSGVFGGLGGAFGGGGGGKDSKVISTKFMLFIFSGAFNTLNDLIKERVGSQTIGFLLGDDEPGRATNVSAGSRPPKEGGAPGGRSYLHLAETSDFVQAGLEPEFIGRVPVRVAIDALDANDLFRILTEAEDSVLRQYEKEFQGYGILFRADRPALRRVAEMAVAEKTGARALVTVLERVLRDFKFELPSTAIKDLTLTEALLEDPASALGRLLSSPEQVRADLQRWLEDVEGRSKVRIDMADDVQSRILKDCEAAGKSAQSVLDARFRATGVIAGLQEIHEATEGKVELFAINMAMYEQPEAEIQKWRKDLEKFS